MFSYTYDMLRIDNFIIKKYQIFKKILRAGESRLFSKLFTNWLLLQRSYSVDNWKILKGYSSVNFEWSYSSLSVVTWCVRNDTTLSDFTMFERLYFTSLRDYRGGSRIFILGRGGRKWLCARTHAHQQQQFNLISFFNRTQINKVYVNRLTI